MRISDPDVALGIKTGGSAFGSVPQDPFAHYPGGYDSTGQYHGVYNYVDVSLFDVVLAELGYPQARLTPEGLRYIRQGYLYFNGQEKVVKPRLYAQNKSTGGIASDATPSVYPADLPVRTTIIDGITYNVYRDHYGKEQIARKESWYDPKTGQYVAVNHPLRDYPQQPTGPAAPQTAPPTTNSAFTPSAPFSPNAFAAYNPVVSVGPTSGSGGLAASANSRRELSPPPGPGSRTTVLGRAAVNTFERPSRPQTPQELSPTPEEEVGQESSSAGGFVFPHTIKETKADLLARKNPALAPQILGQQRLGTALEIAPYAIPELLPEGMLGGVLRGSLVRGGAEASLAATLETSLPAATSSPLSSTEAAALFRARDEAVRVTNSLITQDIAAGHIAPDQVATRYGIIADAVFKSNVRQAVAEGSLPSTFVTSPTVRLNRGFPQNWFNATDVWDTATGRSWDLQTPNTSYFYKHEGKYLGRVMPDGTVITEVNPLLYSRGAGF